MTMSQRRGFLFAAEMYIYQQASPFGHTQDAGLYIGLEYLIIQKIQQIVWAVRKNRSQSFQTFHSSRIEYAMADTGVFVTESSMQ